MVVSRQRTSYRASSVPVDFGDPVRLDNAMLNAHKTRLISNAVLDDTDAMSSASKRHDQELMRDINARLANTSFAQPSPVIPRRASISTHKPPLPVRHVTSSYRVTSHPVETDSDVNHAVDLLIPMTTRALRAGSVPPGSVSVSSPGWARDALLYGGGGGVIKTRVVKNGFPPARVVLNGPGSGMTHHYYTAPPPPHVSRRYHYLVEGNEFAPPIASHYNYYYPQSSAHLTPTTDLAVRQAHRNMDRIERELQTDMTLAPPPTNPPPPIRTYATLDVGPRPLSTLSHLGGPIVTSLRVRSPSPVYRTTGGAAHYNYSPRYGSVPGYYRTSSVDLPRTRDYRTLTDIELSDPLLTSTALYRTKLEPSLTTTTTTLTGGGAEPWVSRDVESIIRSANTLPDSRYSEYRPATRAAGDYRPPSRSTSSVVHKIQPTASPLPPLVQPKAVSETRKRVRDVLCRVKGDPHYFDS